MRQLQPSESAQFSRAARHLIQSHGSQAGAIAMKRAVYLHQCGEDGGADTWRKIGEFVRIIEGGDRVSAGKRTNELGERLAPEAVELEIASALAPTE